MDISAIEADADSSRRRVEDALSGHLRAVAPLLVARGLQARTALGLWHASMGALLHGVGARPAAKLLAARSKAIRGHGQNADVPSSEMSPETEVQVLAEVSAAAKEFGEAIDGAYEDVVEADLEHVFGEVLVEVLAKTLVRLWGPYHARKAFVDQWLSFDAGREIVVHPAEPEEPPQAKHTPTAPLSPNLAGSQEAVRAGRTAGERHADLRV